ncbi:MAG: hypothetical protein U5O16_00805 [Rhodococcus sp. (in: high G+C Gram-positive bacteria)]|uniref:hypothetical protein n=1 Tax=Rhodococcus sp. TaxID=1831 RepID=UPI002ADB0099|nr:hypothetical protein [Rhodococcus sp. (in: high G+C Gram-positive bacteria)]
MSGFSDLLTQPTAPWWAAIASGLVGLSLSSWISARADKKRRQLERQDRWGKDILEYASAYIDAVNQIFNPDFVLDDDELETTRRLTHDRVELQRPAISAGNRLKFVAPTLHPHAQKVLLTTLAFYELDISEESRESEPRAACAKAREEFDAALHTELGVRRQPAEKTSWRERWCNKQGV